MTTHDYGTSKRSPGDLDALSLGCADMVLQQPEPQRPRPTTTTTAYDLPSPRTTRARCQRVHLRAGGGRALSHHHGMEALWNGTAHASKPGF